MKQLHPITYVVFSCLLLVSGLKGYGQSTYWSEDYATPEGWTLEDNWRINGGMLYFDWNPTIYNFDQSATSPFITLDDHVGNLVINQTLSVYNPTENEVAQVVLVHGEEESVVWEYELINGNWGNPSGEDLVIELDDFLGETIQIKLRTYGESTFNWSWWQVLDMRINASYTHDLTVTNIEGPNNIDVFDTGDWIVEVINQGSDPIDNYTVNLIDTENGTVVDQILVTETIEPQENKVFGLGWSPDAAYNTLIYAEVDAEEDQFSGNNLSKASFLRIEPEFEYNILVWDNDNGIQSIVCPEHGDVITPAEGLLRALDDAGLVYDLESYLPEDLSYYDVVISTLGCYCLS